MCVCMYMYAHVNDKYSQRKKKQNSERRNRTEQVQENKKTRNEDGWKIKHGDLAFI